jgi:hypothetical protein
MTAQRRAFEERAGRPAVCIEGHNDVRWTVRAVVRIRDDVSTLNEGAGMIFERFTRTHEAFFNGESTALIPACGESYEHKRGWSNTGHRGVSVDSAISRRLPGSDGRRKRSCKACSLNTTCRTTTLVARFECGAPPELEAVSRSALAKEHRLTATQTRGRQEMRT